MTKLFISYRREDSADTVGRIYDRLVAHFGREVVFKDVDSIPAGANFAQYIDTVLQQCSVLLAVIGPHWLGATDANGQRRLDAPGDFVRLEIEGALTRGIPVVPVLVQRASMPHASDLPPSLAELAMLNAVQVRRDPDFEGDMRRLNNAVERWTRPPQVVPVRPAYPQQSSPQPTHAAPIVSPPKPVRAPPPKPLPMPWGRAILWALAWALLLSINGVGTYLADARLLKTSLWEFPLFLFSVLLSWGCYLLIGIIGARSTGRLLAGVGVATVAALLATGAYNLAIVSVTGNYDPGWLLNFIATLVIAGLLAWAGGAVGRNMFRRART